MNFLAHLHLVNGNESLMLGALLGDFVRGRDEMQVWPSEVRHGIRVHRRIDRYTDASDEVKALQKLFPDPFRRYAGIIIDLGFDHELAKNWASYSDEELSDFDQRVRDLLAQHETVLPPKLKRFMDYAARRGLFEAYRNEQEMLFSLAGIGTRLKRDNPLHQVATIWPEVKTEVGLAFARFYPAIQSEVSDWRQRKSTTTGS